MLIQREKEHLNAIIRIVSDKAQRLEALNKMAGESPIIYDPKLQQDTVEEAIEQAKELRDVLNEAIVYLEKDWDEELEVFEGQK